MNKEKLISILESQDKSALEEFIMSEPAFEFLFIEGLSFFHAKFHFYKNEPASLMGIVGHFLQYAEYYGATKTADDIEKYLKAEKLDGLIVLAICGVSINKPISINENITLIPYCELPDSYYKAVYDPTTVGGDFFVPSFPKEFLKMGEHPISKSFDNTKIKPTAALTYSVSGTRTVPVEIESFKKIYDTLKNACLSLTLIGPIAPTPIAMWWQTADWVNCWPNSQGEVLPEDFDLINRDTISLDSNTIEEEVKKICNSFLSLNEEQRKKLYIPLTRLNNAILRKNYRDKAIELGIAIESTFLNDNDSRTELGCRVQLRAAKLLGKHESYSRKKEIMELFKKLYTHRSTIVHGNNNVKMDDLKTDIEKGILQTDCAIKMLLLDYGNVQASEWAEFWNKLIFDSPEM